MRDRESWINAAISEINAAREHAWELAAAPDRRPGTQAWDRWAAAAAEFTALANALDERIAGIERGIAAAESTAVDAALEYLEADPFYWRSGYTRTRVARRLAAGQLDDEQRRRARDIVLGWVDARLHPGRAGAAPLAGAVANNAMRRALRSRLHDAREGVALRAAYALVHVQHPGYSPADLAQARAVLLHEISRWPYAPVPSFQAAMRLWSPEWESELRDISVVHGPQRAAAKTLLQHVDRRRDRQRRARP